MTKGSDNFNNEIVEYVPKGIEIQIVEQMLDPDMIDKTVTEKCELLGISRKTYYEHMKKPMFQLYIASLIKDLIKVNAAPLVNSAIKHAKAGSFQHFKFLMDMGEIHKEDNKMQLEGAIEHIVTFGRNDDDGILEIGPDNNRIIIDQDPEDPE